MRNNLYKNRERTQQNPNSKKYKNLPKSILFFYHVEPKAYHRYSNYGGYDFYQNI